MKSILITGGAGFIGSNFVYYIMNRYPDLKIHVLDALTYAGNLQNFAPETLKNENFNFWYGNICNAELVGDIMSHVDTVVHFAAESHVARSICDNLVFFQTDVIGTQVVSNQVLRHKKHIKKFIHISTSEVYGTAESDPMDESHMLNPLTPYAAAKVGADRLVYSYINTYNLPALIIRPFNQYGPQQHLEKCIPRFITSIIQKKPITIHGDGLAKRDWVYVTDTCEAICLSLEAPIKKTCGEIINIGTGKSISVLEISKKIIRGVNNGFAETVHIQDRPGQVSRHISSTDKAKKLLGWESKTKIADGIKMTIEWYKTHPEWWKVCEFMKTVTLTESGNRICNAY